MGIGILLDLGDLLSAVVASLVAAIAFTVVISLAILGASKYVDYGTEGRTTEAIGSLVLALLASLVALSIVAAGLYLMIKS